MSVVAVRERFGQLGPDWSDAEMETLRRLAAAGLSASKIAAALVGRSRNAVIRKAKRHRIQIGDGSKSEGGEKDRDLMLGFIGEPVDEPLGSTEFPGPGQCQWIVGNVQSGDYAFCSRKTAPGRTYCDSHHRKAYPGAKAVINGG